jgi:RNAse (barnase) inhibitor barstar
VDCDPTDAPAIDTSLPLMELLGVVANRLDAMPDVLMQEVCMELDIKTTTIKRMSTEEQDSVRQWLIGAIGSV